MAGKTLAGNRMGPQEVISSTKRIGFPGVGIFAHGLVE